MNAAPTPETLAVRTNIRRSLNRRSGRNTVLLGSLVLLIASACAIWTAVTVPREKPRSDADESRVLASALDRVATELAGTMSDAAISDESWLHLAYSFETKRAHAIVGARLSQLGTADSFVIVDRDMNPLVAFRNGEILPRKEIMQDAALFNHPVAVVREQAEPLMNSLRNGNPARRAGAIRFLAGESARLVASTTGLHVVVGLPALPERAAIDPSQADRFVAVGMRNFDPHALAVLGKSAMLHNLHYVAGARTTTTRALLVRGASGAVEGALVWDSQPTPIQSLRDYWLSAAFAFFAIAVLMALAMSLAGERAQDAVHAELSAHLPKGIDPVTRLADHSTFAACIDRELALLVEPGKGLTVLMVRVNPIYVSSADAAIVELALPVIAARLGTIFRATDTLAYCSPWMFGLLHVGLSTPREAQLLARRIVDTFDAAIEVGGRALIARATVGIALAPQDGTDARTLIANALDAVDRAQIDDGQPFSFHERGLDDDVKLRQTMENDLRNGIDEGQLRLHYQPIYAPDGKRMLGVEALVRWQHPTRGLISPVHFISVAEERGLIGDLGAWCLERACTDALGWPGLTVAVNLSPVQFREKDIVQRLLSTISATGIEPWRVELEVTESAVMEDPETAEKQMMELRAAGIRLALDDFGTGYSSLIYLRRFAIDKIKIDKSFLESMETTGESAILVHSVVHLGRALGLTVTAEGVETADQHRFLQAAGCHQLQGYLFSKPVPAERITQMLQTPARPAIALVSAG